MTYTISDGKISSYRARNGQKRRELLLHFLLPEPVNEPLFLHRGEAFFWYMSGNEVRIHIPVREGELKYFLPDYQNYYYLPAEDCAIHKSVSAYASRTHRQQAGPSTAYLRRTGEFLPQAADWVTPSYRKNYRDSLRYFELKSGFCDDREGIASYARHVLSLFDPHACLFS